MSLLASGGYWTVVGASVALLLLSAKAHGRSVRLVRELHGHFDVTFGGVNPPFVEELWRRDRVRFWSAYAVLAAAIVAGLGAAASAEAPLPCWGGSQGFACLAAWGIPSLLLWAPAASFGVAGLAQVLRLRDDLAAPAAVQGEGGRLRRRLDEERERRGAWLRAAMAGTWGWWGAALGLAAAVSVLVFATA